MNANQVKTEAVSSDVQAIYDNTDKLIASLDIDGMIAAHGAWGVEDAIADMAVANITDSNADANQVWFCTHDRACDVLLGMALSKTEARFANK